MPKTYSIKTFGCAMNHSDSERISTFLEENGFKPAENSDSADLIIFNTCGIKQGPENRIYSLINNIRKTDKNCTIILTGCLAKRPDVQKRMESKVDLFCEIKDFPKSVSSILYLVSSMNSKIQNTKYDIQNTKNNFSKEFINYLSIDPKHTNSFQAFVPIMTGCNNFCSYCVVPFARGREISRPADEILSEVKNLVAKEYKHIILLGQNVNSYKSKAYKAKKSIKQEKETDFSQLLKKIDAIPGKFWVSFVSSHPKDMSDELIETVAKCKKVCEWIHLPVQAGNNKVLARMNRKYTQEHYLKLIKKIRSAFKKHKPESIFSISSDIIVGFPGETKIQFADSAKIMEKSKFDMVFFGQFSPRPGTAAWKMKDTVSQTEKARRENFLNDILKKTAMANNKKYVGKIFEVLIEKDPKKSAAADRVAEKNNIYFGKTRTQKNVKVFSDKKLEIGSFQKVRITKANIWNLEGKK